MTLHQSLRLLHVLGAIVWVGSGTAMLVLNRLLVRGRDVAGLRAIGRHAQGLGRWIFVPAALVTVASGVALVANRPAIGFSDPWILIGFAGIVASGIAQKTVVEPGLRTLMELLPDHGFAHPGVTSAARRIAIGDGLDVGALVVVVLAMVIQPGAS